MTGTAESGGLPSVHAKAPPNAAGYPQPEYMVAVRRNRHVVLNSDDVDGEEFAGADSQASGELARHRSSIS